MNIYAYANLGLYDLGIVRFMGSGLGNLLFPWARCIVAAEKHSMQLIEPTWPNIKLGTLLRRESDPRFYADLFFNRPKSIGGVKKLALLALLPRISENELERELDRLTHSHTRSSRTLPNVMIFRGLGGYFNDILRDHKLVRDYLTQMTREKHLQGLKFNFSQSLCVHVRLGDFKTGQQTTDISWYKLAISSLRKSLGSQLSTYVFSDGSDDELAPLLQLPNTTRITFGSSIADIFALSQSRVFIGSRGSTFGMWSCYLGRMPCLFPHGGTWWNLYYEEPTKSIQWDSKEPLPLLFIKHCEDALTRTC